jgi:hypothetical protein
MNTAADIEQLVAHFQPGDTVFIPGSAGEPSELTEMLVNNPDHSLPALSRVSTLAIFAILKQSAKWRCFLCKVIFAKTTKKAG